MFVRFVGSEMWRPMPLSGNLPGPSEDLAVHTVKAGVTIVNIEGRNKVDHGWRRKTPLNHA
jgi:hypothetical protein